MQYQLSNPFNYTGSKFRYLPFFMKIMPLVDNLTVHDMFYGGGDFSSHLNPTWKITGTDTNKYVIEMHTAIEEGIITVQSILEEIESHSLTNTNKLAYDDYRTLYNDCPNPLRLYTLLCHSNSNRIRHSSAGKFNVPFGDRWFNLNMQKKLNAYIQRIAIRKRKLFSDSYHSIINLGLHFDLLLIDPPYLNTCATYSGWNLNEEKELHSYLLSLNSKSKFIYFGQTWSKGVENTLLTDFANKHTSIILPDTTSTCSSNRKKGKTIEVMIHNY